MEIQWEVQRFFRMLVDLDRNHAVRILETLLKKIKAEP